MLTISNLTKITKFDEIEQLLQWLANRLGITSGEVVLVHNDKILDKFSTNDFKIDALLYEMPLDNQYQLIIRSKGVNVETILCHEMVHMSQYMRGDLKLDMNKKEFTWKGRKYENTYPYDSRPWEIEAFNMQGKLFREYKRYKRQKEKELKSENKTRKCFLF